MTEKRTSVLNYLFRLPLRHLFHQHLRHLFHLLLHHLFHHPLRQHLRHLFHLQLRQLFHLMGYWHRPCMDSLRRRKRLWSHCSVVMRCSYPDQLWYWRNLLEDKKQEVSQNDWCNKVSFFKLTLFDNWCGKRSDCIAHVWRFVPPILTIQDIITAITR